MGALCRPSFAYGEKSISVGDQGLRDQMDDTSGSCFTPFPVRKGDFSQNDSLYDQHPNILGAALLLVFKETA